jgi:hypothetical protein
MKYKLIEAKGSISQRGIALTGSKAVAQRQDQSLLMSRSV